MIDLINLFALMLGTYAAAHDVAVMVREAIRNE